MRILIAPGSFGPGLSAVAAAEAIATGWARRAPGDDLAVAPVSDGGAGFLDVVRASLGGHLDVLTLPDVNGAPTAGAVLIVGDTAYVEAAQVAGPGLTGTVAVASATSEPVGRLVGRALAAGVARVVVGVASAGVWCNDGGAGLLAGLGARCRPDGALTGGPAGLERLESVDLSPVGQALGGNRLVLATDDDAPLLGLLGTTSTAGPARGLTAEEVLVVDRQIERFADLVGRRVALARGAGAGGGIGFGLLAVGAVRAPGLGTVIDTLDLAARAARVDLVVTGEEALDFSAGSGVLSSAVAGVAASAVRPCIALAHRVLTGARETRALGIESAYAVRDLVAGGTAADPAESLAALAERVAATWSWSQ